MFGRRKPVDDAMPIDTARKLFQSALEFHTSQMYHFEKIASDAHNLMTQHERAAYAATEALKKIDNPSPFETAIEDFSQEIAGYVPEVESASNEVGGNGIVEQDASTANSGTNRRKRKIEETRIPN